jgi:hypothetical protein
MEFTLNNNYGVAIPLSLEPEGTIYELPIGHSIGFELSGTENPVIDFNINKDEDGFHIPIWPNKGALEIISCTPQ